MTILPVILRLFFFFLLSALPLNCMTASLSPVQSIRGDLGSFYETRELFPGIRPGMSHEEVAAAGITMPEKPFNTYVWNEETGEICTVWEVNDPAGLSLEGMRVTRIGLQFVDDALINLEIQLPSTEDARALRERLTRDLGEPVTKPSFDGKQTLYRWYPELSGCLTGLSMMENVDGSPAYYCLTLNVSFLDLVVPEDYVPPTAAP